MMQEIPKQFININGKPVITYTLNAFERHPDIDEIGVVCRSGWEEILKAFAEQAGIKNLNGLSQAGRTGKIRFERELKRRNADTMTKTSFSFMMRFAPWSDRTLFLTALFNAGDTDLLLQWYRKRP